MALLVLLLPAATGPAAPLPGQNGDNHFRVFAACLTSLARQPSPRRERNHRGPPPQGRSGDDAPPRRLEDSIFLRYGASDDFFSSSFNTSSGSNCLIQPGTYTADPEPAFDCRQEPFAWERDGVVQIQCPGPVRWIEEGHEVLVNQGLAKAHLVEKDSPVWERRNDRSPWRSGQPHQLRHTAEFLEVRCGKRRQQFMRLQPRADVAARVPPPLRTPPLA
eukprot:EG_transcript_29087